MGDTGITSNVCTRRLLYQIDRAYLHEAVVIVFFPSKVAILRYGADCDCRLQMQSCLSLKPKRYYRIQLHLILSHEFCQKICSKYSLSICMKNGTKLLSSWNGKFSCLSIILSFGYWLRKFDKNSFLSFQVRSVVFACWATTIQSLKR